jgi:hypothetical protein
VAAQVAQVAVVQVVVVFQVVQELLVKVEMEDQLTLLVAGQVVVAEVLVR